MQIENIDYGFVQTVENGIVERVSCKYNDFCVVHFYDRPPKKLSVILNSYHSQYGIPVSNDGRKLFIGYWEKRLDDFKKGLQAYDIESGSMIWRVNEEKIRSIFVYSDYLVTVSASNSILKINIDSGEVLGQIKSTTIEIAYDLGFPYVAVDTISGKLSIIDVENMLVVKAYSKKTVNPSNCLSCVIQDVIRKDNMLTVIGFEDYPQMNYSSSDQKDFNRIIDTSFGA